MQGYHTPAICKKKKQKQNKQTKKAAKCNKVKSNKMRYACIFFCVSQRFLASKFLFLVKHQNAGATRTRTLFCLFTISIQCIKHCLMWRAEPSGLSELRQRVWNSKKLIFLEFMGQNIEEKKAVHREDYKDLQGMSLNLLAKVYLCKHGMNIYKVEKRSSTSYRLNNSPSSHRFFAPVARLERPHSTWGTWQTPQKVLTLVVGLNYTQHKGCSGSTLTKLGREP